MNRLLREIMGPWTAYVLWVLFSDGPLRFGKLKRRMPGISSKVLTQRLRRLEAAGLVFRRYRPTVPPEVTYGLKPRGRQLSEALKSLELLAVRWATADKRKRRARASDPGTER
ncbi:MAG: helix-turn-helix transcriptional regulator [Acidobacteria bacterium]|nr:helix-turn-helix transcriptional regulator [Acidobacteriota bacterium]